MKILRVTCDPEGQNYVHAHNGALFDRDFPTDVALDNGRLVQGHATMDKFTHRYSLKTIISVRAGIQRLETLQQLPGGEEFYSVYSSYLVTDDIIDDIVREHFVNLRDEAIKKTKEQMNLRLVIDKVILTHPNYLPHEGGDDFYRWTDYVEWIWTQVWDEHNMNIQFHCISEGQSIGSYISARFDHTATDFTRGKLWKELNLPGKYHGFPMFPILVIDAGGSSVNIQHIVLKFDSSGQVQCSQTHDVVDTSPGVIGGSHLSNYRIRNEIIRRGSMFTEKEQARLLKDYESKKYGFDYTKQRGLLLQGGTSRAIMELSADFVREAFDDVFKDALKMIKREIDLLLLKEYRFGVVFCGGSFLVLGFCEQIRAYMDSHVAREAQIMGSDASYAFLSLCDTTWSSAVATGAAASREGIFQFDMDNKKPDHKRYELVCQPDFAHDPIDDGDLDRPAKRPRGRPRKSGSRNGQPCFKIPRPMIPVCRQKLLGPYDMSFMIDASEVPRGKIRWQVEKEGLPSLGPDGNPPRRVPMDASIVMRLHCYRINEDGQRMKDGKNRSWELTITSDPGSHLLIVEQERIVL
ncbi:hypothetical protein E8E14_014331 [Neopestalotiopsis sp. 37M]|nr:hypothetical protein E8E14_014331 [Neopestalotiopsis sp. 37M]